MRARRFRRARRPASATGALAPRGALCAGLLLLLVGAGQEVARAELLPGVAAGAHLFSPEARIGRSPSGDAAANPVSMAAVGLRLTWLPIARAGLEGEALVVPTWSGAPGAPRATVLGYAASLRINVLTGTVRPFVLAGVGAQTLLSGDRGVLADGTMPFVQAGAGVELLIGARLAMRLEGRAQFVAALGSAPFAVDGEALLGLAVRLGKEGEGRPSATGAAAESAAVCPPCPACPACPAPAEGAVAVAVAAVGAAAEPKGKKEEPSPPPPDPKGRKEEPSPLPPLGVEPEGDGDLDGVVNQADRCPARPGPSQNGGCPDVDSDGDAIVDRIDQCADQPESDNEWQDEDGCPDEVPADLKPFLGIQRGIAFHASSVELLPESNGLLDELAAVLHARPTLRLHIAAYTDSSGNPDKNVRLSQQRADAVRDYLLGRGIAQARLRAVGYGPTSPVESNDTLAGRSANRRIELHLLP